MKQFPSSLLLAAALAAMLLPSAVLAAAYDYGYSCIGQESYDQVGRRSCVGTTYYLDSSGSAMVCVGTFYWPWSTEGAFCLWDLDQGTTGGGIYVGMCGDAYCGDFVAVDSPPGPKTWCESASEWAEHVYTHSAALAPAHDGNLADCDGDGVPADFDGHADWSLGGAFLQAAEPALGCGPAAQAPHHPLYGPIAVDDAVLGAGASFVVGADDIDLVGGGCGDFQDDVSMSCVGACTVPFPPGLDGAYHVHVDGVGGRVRS
jgi:hypothetical protein